MKITEEQEQLLREYAKFYSSDNFGLEDKIDEEKLEELTNLLRYPEVEHLFNGFLEEYKPKRKKKKEL